MPSRTKAFLHHLWGRNYFDATDLAHIHGLNLEVALWAGVYMYFWEPKPDPKGIVTPQSLVVCQLANTVAWAQDEDGAQAGLRKGYSFGAPLNWKGQIKICLVGFNATVFQEAQEKPFIVVQPAV